MPRPTMVHDRKTPQIYDLDQGIRIGRGAGMDVEIDDVSVSWRQAEIPRDGDHWLVGDIGSSSGTFVNGEWLAGTGRRRRARLGNGDVIRIGPVRLTFRAGDTERPPAAGREMRRCRS